MIQLLTEGKEVVVPVENLNLMNLLNLLVFCLMTASLSCFLSKCMEKGMIFRKYYNWITYWFWLPNKSEIYIHKCSSEIFSYPFGIKELYWTQVKFKKNKYQWLYKVLGGCIYCFGTWVFIVLFFFLFRAETNIIGLFLGIGTNYLFIEAILKLKHENN